MLLRKNKYESEFNVDYQMKNQVIKREIMTRTYFWNEIQGNSIVI